MLMNKTIIISAGMLFLIILISFASAVTIEDTGATDSQMNVFTQQVNSKFDSINSKLDLYAKKSDIESLLLAQLVKQKQINDAMLTSMILNACFLILATLGLGYGVYFYFKSKNRI